MKPLGITPPLISSRKSRPAPGSAGSSSIWRSRTARDRRSASCSGRAPSRACGSTPGTGRAGVQVDLAPALLHPVDDHLDVDLGESGDDLLARLLIAVDVERRVLLHETADSAGGLLLVALRLRLEGERHHRRGQIKRQEGDPPRPSPPARRRRAGLLQLCDRADVARAELVDLLVLLAQGDERCRLRSFARRVTFVTQGRPWPARRRPGRG